MYPVQDAGGHRRRRTASARGSDSGCTPPSTGSIGPPSRPASSTASIPFTTAPWLIEVSMKHDRGMPSLKLRLPETPPRGWPSGDRGRLHHESVTARLGAAVGIAIGICFVTGVISHHNSHPWAWLPPPATPAGGYRFTQGLHVITGFATIPCCWQNCGRCNTSWPSGHPPGRSCTR